MGYKQCISGYDIDLGSTIIWAMECRFIMSCSMRVQCVVSCVHYIVLCRHIVIASMSSTCRHMIMSITALVHSTVGYDLYVSPQCRQYRDVVDTMLTTKWNCYKQCISRYDIDLGSSIIWSIEYRFQMSCFMRIQCVYSCGHHVVLSRHIVIDSLPSACRHFNCR